MAKKKKIPTATFKVQAAGGLLMMKSNVRSA